MNGIETLNYLNRKYANNGVKFENTGTAIKITDGENAIYLNENPKDEKEADYLVKLNVQCLTGFQKIVSCRKNSLLMKMKQ